MSDERKTLTQSNSPLMDKIMSVSKLTYERLGENSIKIIISLLKFKL